MRGRVAAAWRYAALLLAAAALPALAGSRSASSVAGGSSASSAGSSASERSSERSSESSSRTQRAAEGQYTIIDVATMPERPGQVRLRLRALADTRAEGELLLVLPRPTFERSRLAPGQTVSAHHRPYGLEFAHGEPRQAFFLVLDDDWYRELTSNAVVL